MRSDVLNVNSNDFLKDSEGVMVAKIHAVLSDFTDGGGTSGTYACLLYTSPSPRDGLLSRMPSSA